MLKKHQEKYAERHKMPMEDHVPLICFFEQCQHADHMSGILDQIQKKKRRRPQTSQVPTRPTAHTM
jgi:hypothetical protein